MARFKMNGKTLGGLFLGLWAPVFFSAPGVSLEMSSSGMSWKESGSPPMLLAQKEDKKEGMVESPLVGRADYKEDLKKAMNDMFRVLNTILNEPGLSLKEKQKMAEEHIRAFRYGRENKDTFWINDLQGIMRVDPYLAELEGKDLSEFTDPNGIKIFEKIIKSCREQGEGYVTYLWPKYDQKEWNQPNISLVRLFKPWDWVIGTRLFLKLIEVYDMPERPGVIDDTEPASPI